MPDIQQIQQYQNLQNQIAQLGTLLGVPQNGAHTPTLPPQQIEYVDGLDGARAYLNDRMGANSSAVVWNRNSDEFYSLSKDANGAAARIQIGTFTLEPEPTPEDRYVTKEDFKALADKLDRLLSKEGVE